MTIIRAGQLREVSLLPVGADPKTTAIVAKGKRMADEKPNLAETIDDDLMVASWERFGLSDPQRIQARYRAMDVADANLREEAAGLFLQAGSGALTPTQFDLAMTRIEARDGRLRAIRAERPQAPAIHESTRDVSPQVMQAAF